MKTPDAIIFKSRERRGAKRVEVVLEAEAAPVDGKLWADVLAPGGRPLGLAQAHVATRTSEGQTAFGVLLLGPGSSLVGWIVAPEVYRAGGTYHALETREEALEAYEKTKAA